MSIRRIYSDALLQQFPPAELAKGKGKKATSECLENLYLLTGADHQLRTESQDAIKRGALAAGASEQFSFQIDNETQWADIFDLVQSYGLFSQKRLLQLTFPENITATLQNQLLALMETLHADLILVIALPKFSRTQEKQRWFAYAQDKLATVIVNCHTPAVEQLPQWVHKRATLLGVNLDNNALQLLCYSYEGNLMALQQALQLLSLLHGDKKVYRDDVQAVIEQSTQFTVFQWTDSLLAGNLPRALHILQGLRQEDISPIILLRTVQRELMTLLDISQTGAKIPLNSPLDLRNSQAHFERLRIWQQRRTLLTQAGKRLTYRQLFELLQTLANLERQVKNQFDADIWADLQHFCKGFCVGNQGSA